MHCYIAAYTPLSNKPLTPQCSLSPCCSAGACNLLLAIEFHNSIPDYSCDASVKVAGIFSQQPSPSGKICSTTILLALTFTTLPLFLPIYCSLPYLGQGPLRGIYQCPFLAIATNHPPHTELIQRKAFQLASYAPSSAGCQHTLAFLHAQAMVILI